MPILCTKTLGELSVSFILYFWIYCLCDLFGVMQVSHGRTNFSNNMPVQCVHDDSI